MTTNTFDTREAWLRAAVRKMAPWLKEQAELELDVEKTPALCGFAKGIRGKNVIGACYHHGVVPEDEKQRVIFIFPTLDRPVQVLETLLHEMVHAALPNEVAHKGPFKRAVKALGLAGKATATYAEEGSPLHIALTALAEELGPYPHSRLAPIQKPGKKSKGWPRYKSINEPAYKVLVSPKMLDAHGAPRDPWGDEMVPNDQEEEGDEE